MKPPKPYKQKKRKNGIYYVIDKITKSQNRNGIKSWTPQKRVV